MKERSRDPLRERAGAQDASRPQQGTSQLDDQGLDLRAAVAALLLTLIASFAPALATAAEPEPPGEPQPEEIAAQQAWEQEHQPSPLPDRQASASAHEDLGRDAAASLASSAFAEYFDSLDDSPLPNPGDEILRYIGTEAIVVEPAGAPERQVAISSTPLQVENATGNLKPVDTDLERTTDGYEPARAGVELNLPTDLAEGIELPAEDVVIGFEDSADASAPKQVESSSALFYADVAADTDLIVSPVYGGFSFAAVVRSAEAPEQIRIPLDLPATAEVELDPELGSVVVDLPGPESITISAPIALDADLRPVTSKFSLRGGEPVLEIAHSEGTPAYPILVDPTVIGNHLIADDELEANALSRGWRRYEGTWGSAFETPFTPTQYGPGAVQGSSYTGGLWVEADTGYNGGYAIGFGGDTRGRWRMTVPHVYNAAGQFIGPQATTAYFDYVQFRDIRHWQNGHPYNYPATQAGIHTLSPRSWAAGPLAFYTHEFSPGYWVGPTNNQAAKEVVFEQWAGAAGATISDNTSVWSHLGAYTVYLADLEWPTVDATSGVQGANPGPTAWTKDPISTVARFSASDGGLGIKRMKLKGGPHGGPGRRPRDSGGPHRWYGKPALRRLEPGHRLPEGPLERELHLQHVPAARGGQQPLRTGLRPADEVQRSHQGRGAQDRPIAT